MTTTSGGPPIGIMFRPVLRLARKIAWAASPVFAFGCTTNDFELSSLSGVRTHANAAVTEHGLAARADVPGLDHGAGVRAAHLATLFNEAQRDSRYIVR